MSKTTISTKDYLNEVEREVKKLEIRSQLAGNAQEKRGVLDALKGKKKLARWLRSMVSGSIEYKEKET